MSATDKQAAREPAAPAPSMDGMRSIERLLELAVLGLHRAAHAIERLVIAQEQDGKRQYVCPICGSTISAADVTKDGRVQDILCDSCATVAVDINLSRRDRGEV